MSTVDSIVPTDTLRGVGRRVLGAPLRTRTYCHLLYLVLAAPLGVVYGVGLVTGTAVGVGLLVTWVGLPILLATLAGAAAAAGIEARLASRLVGVDATVPAFLRAFDAGDGLALPGDGFFDAVRRLVTAPLTWTAVVPLMYTFVFGLVALVAMVTVGSVSAALLAAPFVYDDAGGVVGAATAGQYRIGSWTVRSLPEAVAVAAVGALVFAVGLSLLSALARVHARSTAAILRVGPGAGR
jgi:hypothetical protein